MVHGPGPIGRVWNALQQSMHLIPHLLPNSPQTPRFISETGPSFTLQLLLHTWPLVSAILVFANTASVLSTVDTSLKVSTLGHRLSAKGG